MINSWEAAYFGFTGETMLELAKAADVGIDLVVMDVGGLEKETMTIADRRLGSQRRETRLFTRDFDRKNKRVGC